MAIRLYDEAVAKKINSWLPKADNGVIQVLKPDETNRLFSIEADINNDKPLQLPLLALSRNTQISISRPVKCPMSYNGLTLEKDAAHTLQLDAIPISLNYQLDIYTRRYDEGDELLREMIFKLINNPQIVIELPYQNLHLESVASIQLDGSIEDTSAITQRLFSGHFTRWTLNFNVIGAYLFSVPYVDNFHIEYELEVKQNKGTPAKFIKEEL